MDKDTIALIVIGLITASISYFISALVYKKMVAKQNKYARLIQVLVGLGVFALIVLLLIVYLISQMSMKRM